MTKSEKGIDIYRKWDSLDSERKRLKKSNISEANKKAISDYQIDLSSRNVGKNRIIKLSIALRMLAGYLGKNFGDATKEDIVLLVQTINESSKYSAYTKSDFKQTLKQFYKFLKGDGTDFPSEVKWISKAVKNKDVKILHGMWLRP